MSTIREEEVYIAINRAYSLINYNIYDDIHKQHKFQQQTILADKSLTENEKTEAIKMLNKTYDSNKVLLNKGTRRTCENCNQECLATLYCEYCVRNHLKENFPNWTSGNDKFDNLIRTCQMKTLDPRKIVEWIPYDNLQNIKYLTEGGCSKIYTAHWINGLYYEWDSKKQQLKRQYEGGAQLVVLKRLENVENANQDWLEEAKSHLTISNKWNDIVQCHGLTKDPSDGNYMLVMNKLNTDLRNYVQQNHNQLTWGGRIQIANKIIEALCHIHEENAIHRDLHSGNILIGSYFSISDLGFCGPADKLSTKIYGNLPYIAPEVIFGKGYTFKSDIYSFAMIMWEISAGRPPFSEYKHDFDFVMNVINGMRPKIVPGTPLEYENLMMQCWDADPSKRPDSYTLLQKLREINLLYQNVPVNVQNDSFQLKANNDLNMKYTSRLFGSKVHQFENISEPKNATEEEQEALHYKSKICDFCIPENVEDFSEPNDQKKD